MRCPYPHLQEPVAAPVEGLEDGGVDVAAVDTLHSLHLQLHVILPRCLPVPALLPAEPVSTVTHLLATVEHHRATRWPGTGRHEHVSVSINHGQCFLFKMSDCSRSANYDNCSHYHPNN